jgi:hypothetical protein
MRAAKSGRNTIALTKTSPSPTQTPTTLALRSVGSFNKGKPNIPLELVSTDDEVDKSDRGSDSVFIKCDHC